MLCGMSSCTLRNEMKSVIRDPFAPTLRIPYRYINEEINKASIKYRYIKKSVRSEMKSVICKMTENEDLYYFAEWKLYFVKWKSVLSRKVCLKKPLWTVWSPQCNHDRDTIFGLYLQRNQNKTMRMLGVILVIRTEESTTRLSLPPPSSPSLSIFCLRQCIDEQ